VYTMRLIEKACYTAEFDAVMRAGVKSAKSSEEMVNSYAQFKEECEKIKDAIANETEKLEKALKDTKATTKEDVIDIAKTDDRKKDDEKTEAQYKQDAFNEDPWTRYAERCLDSRAHLYGELDTMTQNATYLKNLDLSKVRTPEGKTTAICFATNLNAEGITNPHTRTPPLRKDRLQKLGSAILKARAPLFQEDGDMDKAAAEEQPGTGDVFIALDGSKPGNHNKLTNWIKGSKITKQITIVYEYDTIKERKFRSKGVGTMCMTETLLLTTSSILRLPEVKYENVPGGTKGSSYGPAKAS
jgi:Skp family chaperone for outer membrane proteins